MVMHRTSLMLPEALQRRAAKLARQRGISLGQLIRQCLSREAELDQQTATTDPFWNAPETFRSRRHDLSVGHDDELYGPLRTR
jgi:hypothetical protein